MIVLIFHLIVNQTEFCLIDNRKETRQYDHIPFNLKVNGNPSL